MLFYTVDDAYISYLKNIDRSVPNNYQGKRPFIGIVLEVEGIKYLAPLTSYKAKQDQIKPGLPTILKLHERTNPTNKLGMVQINNMIPVNDEVIALLDLASQPEPYKSMLYKQYEFLKQHKEVLEHKANKLYQLVTVKNDSFFSRISCSFKALENACEKYCS